MSALSVIPHSPTGEQPHVSDELHTLLEQLDESELASLAAILYTRVPKLSRLPEDGLAVLSATRAANLTDHHGFIDALGEWTLLWVLLAAVQTSRSA